MRTSNTHSPRPSKGRTNLSALLPIIACAAILLAAMCGCSMASLPGELTEPSADTAFINDPTVTDADLRILKNLRDDWDSMVDEEVADAYVAEAQAGRWADLGDGPNGCPDGYATPREYVRVAQIASRYAEEQTGTEWEPVSVSYPYPHGAQTGANGDASAGEGRPSTEMRYSDDQYVSILLVEKSGRNQVGNVIQVQDWRWKHPYRILVTDEHDKDGSPGMEWLDRATEITEICADAIRTPEMMADIPFVMVASDGRAQGSEYADQGDEVNIPQRMGYECPDQMQVMDIYALRPIQLDTGKSPLADETGTLVANRIGERLSEYGVSKIRLHVPMAPISKQDEVTMVNWVRWDGDDLTDQDIAVTADEATEIVARGYSLGTSFSYAPSCTYRWETDRG